MSTNLYCIRCGHCHYSCYHDQSDLPENCHSCGQKLVRPNAEAPIPFWVDAMARTFNDHAERYFGIIAPEVVKAILRDGDLRLGAERMVQEFLDHCRTNGWGVEPELHAAAQEHARQLLPKWIEANSKPIEEAIAAAIKEVIQDSYGPIRDAVRRLVNEVVDARKGELEQAIYDRLKGEAPSP